MKRNVLIVMCAGLFVVLLDVTIVNVALPSIAADRHAGLADLQWVVDGYQIALAGLLLTGGTLGNRFRTPAGGAGGRGAADAQRGRPGHERPYLGVAALTVTLGLTTRHRHKTLV